MNYMTDMQHDNKPWYRQFWPWLLILLPATAVFGGIATIFIASYEPDSVVVDEYYKEGLAINRDLAKDQIAVRMDIKARMHIDTAQQQITLHMTANEAIKTPEMHLHLLHPTLSQQDQDITLKKTASGVYRGFLRLPGKGDWNLVLEPANHQWRLARRVELTLNKDVVLR